MGVSAAKDNFYVPPSTWARQLPPAIMDIRSEDDLPTPRPAEAVASNLHAPADYLTHTQNDTPVSSFIVQSTQAQSSTLGSRVRAHFLRSQAEGSSLVSSLPNYPALDIISPRSFVRRRNTTEATAVISSPVEEHEPFHVVPLPAPISLTTF
jgi:hypothetical protein